MIRIGIKFSPRNIVSRVERAAGRTGTISNRFFERVTDFAREELDKAIEETTRTRTGNLLKSVRTLQKKKTGGELDRRANIDIEVSAPYASFVDRGTKPSPGKFVPIRVFASVSNRGFRTGVGTHPGNQPAGFSILAAQRVNQKFSVEANDHWVRPMANEFKRFQ